ncbi:hypothetical protein [Candidatus Bathycorpusculum sp.]|uniref:hypothetical protein n=1 Tax=Candidatus Bathycorpusculum sp. TaxID=2994959 RepID=UPI002836A5B4|nr:hypothetical protein [Candidatus Termitimicrobium sp.]
MPRKNNVSAQIIGKLHQAEVIMNQNSISDHIGTLIEFIQITTYGGIEINIRNMRCLSMSFLAFLRSLTSEHYRKMEVTI